MNNRLVVLAGILDSERNAMAEQFKEKGYCIIEENGERQFEKIKEKLNKGYNVLYNAPNTTYRERRDLLIALENINCRKTCIVIAVPYEECLKKEENKEQITKRYLQWSTPYYYEGWDKVNIALGKYQNYYGAPEGFIERSKEIKRSNKKEARTLGGHCLETSKQVESKSSTLITACMLHDCGKLFTKKKEHSNVGAYDSFFYEVNDPLRCSILVNLHMIPYAWESNGKRNEMIKNRYYRIWGKQLFRNVMKIHQADINSK